MHNNHKELKMTTIKERLGVEETYTQLHSKEIDKLRIVSHDHAGILQKHTNLIESHHDLIKSIDEVLKSSNEKLEKITNTFNRGLWMYAGGIFVATFIGGCFLYILNLSYNLIKIYYKI